MRKINFGFAAILLLSAATFIQAQSADVPRYQLPPKEVVDAFDAQPLPAALLSPTKQMFALTYRHPNPTIAELSQPILRIAGARVNPRNNGPQRTQEVYAITLRKIADGRETFASGVETNQGPSSFAASASRPASLANVGVSARSPST